ncbi:MAG: glycosyltransferase family 4 protein [Janthinobacterium lividum]
MAGVGRVAIVTDAWAPQVNGVVRTLTAVAAELGRMGVAVEVIGPDRFRTVPCPTYPEIRLAVLPRRKLGRMLREAAPDSLHIATEGPLGMAARALCRRHGWRYTTSFHTRFPEYLRARTGLPLGPAYAVLRRFHNGGCGTMVATESLHAELEGRGFSRLRRWSRGVDLSVFVPEPREAWEGLARPVFAYVGRVAVEKNIAAFLALDLPGSKVVVGDGPMLPALRRRYPAARFVGARFGAQLAASFAGADVKVFPSRTDTFGLVVLESLACGTPVAAFPVTGPRDIVREGVTGALDEDLRAACLRALDADRGACRAYAEGRSWGACAEQFLGFLVPAGIAA